MPEEDAFGVLVQLMQDYRLRELFKPSMSELGVCLHQLDSLVQVCNLLKRPKYVCSELLKVPWGVHFHMACLLIVG